VVNRLSTAYSFTGIVSNAIEQPSRFSGQSRRCHCLIVLRN
jgi:hypothetical protein